MSTEVTYETRRYRKRLRAEQEHRTRQAITEAAMRLHGTVGPARTTVSAVADEAGVQRATVYRHFPDEATLFEACSSHYASLHPPLAPGQPPYVREASAAPRRSTASSMIRETSSSNPIPAASAAIGKRLVSVSPGIAFASSTSGRPSVSSIRSTRANPVQPSAEYIREAASRTSAATSSA